MIQSYSIINLKGFVSMKKWEKASYLLLSSYITIVIVHIVLHLTPQGVFKIPTWYINGAEYHLPASVKITQPSTVIAVSYFYADRGGKYYVILPEITCHAFEFYVNGKLAYAEGYPEGYVNVWTKTFQFPVKFLKGRNEMKIVFHNLYTLTFRKIPYISQKPYKRNALLNILVDFGSKASSGIAFIMGIVLAIWGYRKSGGKSYNTYFAHAFMFLGIYVFDTSFWEFYLTQSEFLLLKRVCYFSIAISMAFFTMASDILKTGKVLKNSRILAYLSLPLSFFVLLYPNYYTARYVHLLSSPYLLLLTVIFLVKMISYKEKNLVVASFLVLLGNFQHALFVFVPGFIPTTIGYSTTYLSIVFTFYLLTQHRQIEVSLLKANEELFKDPLTGAYNRRILGELGINCEDALIFFDMDDFKKINDIYGHDYGDEALKKFVEIAKRIVRKTDYVIRYGGDEFVVLLKGCDEKRAKNIARKIVKNFHEKTKAHVSFGISTGYVNIYDALKAADQNMYRIKRSKKGSQE